MHSIGIDVGASQHSVAICREGNIEAERQVLRIASSRSGFAELDRWMARQGAVERIVVESSGTIGSRSPVTCARRVIPSR